MSSEEAKATRKNGLDKKEQEPQIYKEALYKCESEEDCNYKTKIKVKIGNNQRILLLMRHYDNEYYLIIHQQKLIVSYPMIYRKIAPHKSLYSYKEFYEKGDEKYDVQNKRGKERCEKYDFGTYERAEIPIFEGFNNKPLSICCSCIDLPHLYDSINNIYSGIPKNMKLHCPRDNATNRRLYKERLVSIKKSVRHLLPFYAIFRFKSDIKIFLVFNITTIKKEKSFSEYYQLYKDKTDLTSVSYRYVLDESPQQIKLFDDKLLNIEYSSFAFDNINIPTIHNNYLLYPFFPEELHNIKYDTLDYGCSYNKAIKFECIENDETKCKYTDSTCLKRSVLIPKNFVSDKSDACGLIGYNDESIARNENCLEASRCIRNTVESYLIKAQEITKGNEEIMTKLPIINGKYPHYIFKKKKDIDIPDKRTVNFFTDSNIDHYIAYEYFKEDRTEFTLNIKNIKKNEILQSYENLEYKENNLKNNNNDSSMMCSDSNTNVFYKTQDDEQKEEEKENLYDGTVFYLETLNELRIINILYSDICDELNKNACGVLVHIWNPSKEAIKARLKLQCIINVEEKYIDEKNLVYDEGTYQFLYFFKVPLDKFVYFRNCTVYAYGAFKLYDSQTYIQYKKGFFRNLLSDNTNDVSGIKLYSEGIKRFICCYEDEKICKIKNIPVCKTNNSLTLIKILIFIFLIFFILIPLVYFINKKKKKIERSAYRQQ